MVAIDSLLVTTPARRASVTSLVATAPWLRTSSSSLLTTSPFERPTPPRAPTCERFGPYRVFEQLGEGGMASVHRAELAGVAGFRKSIALKRMRTDLSEDPEFVDAFVREAQIASRIRHPNVAQAFELGKVEGTYYIAMELVVGPTLAQIMRQARRAAGAIPLPIVVELLIQLCDALEHVHDVRDDSGRPLQLIHRDISPTNIIVSRSGLAKLIDFGIAKHRSTRLRTETGVLKGKHAYLAPEYTYGQLDQRADLFALGVVAHELLTGRRLFVADSELATVRAVRDRPVHPPSRFHRDVPADLDAIVMTALARDPAQRWQNAGAMRVALETLVREMGWVVKGREIRDWVEWAFEQEPDLTTPVRVVLDGPEDDDDDEDNTDEEDVVSAPLVALGSGPVAAPPRPPRIDPVVLARARAMVADHDTHPPFVIGAAIVARGQRRRGRVIALAGGLIVALAGLGWAAWLA
jgi:serine/threonine protein kinase